MTNIELIILMIMCFNIPIASSFNRTTDIHMGCSLITLLNKMEDTSNSIERLTEEKLHMS